MPEGAAKVPDGSSQDDDEGLPTKVVTTPRCQVFARRTGELSEFKPLSSSRARAHAVLLRPEGLLRGTAIVGMLLSLAACGPSVDAEQARLCRSAIPALNPEGGHFTVLRTSPGPEPRSLRVDYAVERPDRPPLDRFVLCRFAAEGLSSHKADIVGIETEHGPLAPANLYFLKRYYLESPEGLAGDPGDVARPDLMQVPLPLAYGVQQFLASLPRTAIYGLLAAAYALVFGLVDRINLAFGELAAVGAAATVAGAAMALAIGTAAPLLGLAAGLACALAAGALHGAVGGHFTIARVLGSSPQPSLIATVGLSLALMEYLRLVQSPVTVWLPPVWSESWPILRAGGFVVGLTPMSLMTTGLGLTAALAILALMHLSGFGRAWRAYADDPRAASLCGVDGARLLLQTLALSGALAGLAGTLIVAQYGGLGFAGGFQFGLKALIAGVIGGIGSVAGALLGGCFIALFETAWSATMPIEGRDIALYAALIAFLILRPGGMLGSREPAGRAV